MRVDDAWIHRCSVAIETSFTRFYTEMLQFIEVTIKFTNAPNIGVTYPEVEVAVGCDSIMVRWLVFGYGFRIADYEFCLVFFFLAGVTFFIVFMGTLSSKFLKQDCGSGVLPKGDRRYVARFGILHYLNKSFGSRCFITLFEISRSL